MLAQETTEHIYLLFVYYDDVKLIYEENIQTFLFRCKGVRGAQEHTNPSQPSLSSARRETLLGRRLVVVYFTT